MSARGQRGFTLIELLIALALTGLVALLLLSGTRMAALGTDRVAAQAERLETRRALEDLLRRELSGAIASPLLPHVPPLVGGSQQLEFLSLAEDSGAGLYRIRLTVEGAGGARALVLTRDSGGAGPPPRTLLAPRLASFAIAYFGRPVSGDGAKWYEHWDGAGTLPELVRITLDLGDGIARPPLVVRLWAAGG